MGNLCSSSSRSSGKKIQGSGGEVVPLEGQGHAIVCAFNYECTDNYDPGSNGCGQLSCIPDGEHFAKLCEAAGLNVECYYDAQSGRSKGFPDKEMIKGKIEQFAQSLGPDDFFVFFYAGHGTQGEGGDSSEIDGKDEEMCFVDQTGQYTAFTDNEVAALLTEFNDDTHVLFVTDCCQSATVCDLSRPELADKHVVHLAAVKDSQFAQDLGDGGAFTSSLCETLEYMVNDEDYEGDFSVTDVYNACFDHYSDKFDAQDFCFEKTECVDPDAFKWPVVPPAGWHVDTALD